MNSMPGWHSSLNVLGDSVVIAISGRYLNLMGHDDSKSLLRTF